MKFETNQIFENTYPPEAAIYCNEYGLIIKEIEPRRYQIQAIPEPTIEEKQSSVRSVRNQYLSDTDKYMISDYPIAEEERAKYVAYRTYLRDYTEADEWYESNPKTFDEWKEDLNATEQIKTMGDVYGTVQSN